MNTSMRARVGRFVDLTVKWGTLIGLLFFSEYVVSALLKSYRDGGKSLLEITILLVFFIIYIVLLAFLTIFYPSLQNLLDNMFGHARVPEADRSTKHEEGNIMPLSIHLISIFCLMLIIIHAIFPEYAIDNITLALIIMILIPRLAPSIIMIIPGLARYLKSIKILGIELEIREKIEHLEGSIIISEGIETVQQIEELARVSPEISEVAVIQSRDTLPEWPASTRQDLLRTDPTLALASLRIEIEKKLKKIARQEDIFINRKSLAVILKGLYTNEIISSSIYSTLRSVIDICNKAVHAEKVDHSAASRIIDIGESALLYLSSIQYKPAYPVDRWEFLWFRYTQISEKPWGDFISRSYVDGIDFDYDWKEGIVENSGLSNNVAFRASRTLQLDAGRYTFLLGADDGIRLYVRNSDFTVTYVERDEWRDQQWSEFRNGPLDLPAGDYKILIEWYEHYVAARAQFKIVKEDSE